MTIERAIEIFDPDNSIVTDDDNELEEAMRLAVEALLRMQVRVLGCDEFVALPDDAPVVEESKYPIKTWDKGTMLKWRGTPYLKERAEDHCWYNRDGYGRIWRCWTAWPTDEQRGAVKWK